HYYDLLIDQHAFPTRRSSDLFDEHHPTSFPSIASIAFLEFQPISPSPYFSRFSGISESFPPCINTPIILFPSFAACSISQFTHLDRKSTRLISSHVKISYAVF